MLRAEGEEDRAAEVERIAVCKTVDEFMHRVPGWDHYRQGQSKLKQIKA
jgi:hypothetical protein